MFRFNGTAVYIFGAKRLNYGHYIVQVDDEQPQRFDAYPSVQSNGSYIDLFQEVSRRDLLPDLEYTITKLVIAAVCSSRLS